MTYEEAVWRHDDALERGETDAAGYYADLARELHKEIKDSGSRHLAKFMDGWEDEDHLVAAAWNILWALQMRCKKPELCDVPWRDDNETQK